jgi:tight adherence protein C
VTAAILTGAGLGLGVLLVVAGWWPAAPTLAAQLAEVDAARWTGPVDAPAGRRSRWRAGLAGAFAARGWVTPSLRADLAVTGRDLDAHLARKFGFAAAGLLAPPLLAAAVAASGAGVPVLVPLWVAVCAAVVAFLLPDVTLRQAAAARRRDYRTAVGAFLDLVAMRMASGAGLAEALTEAAAVGDGPAFAHIRGALADARTDGLAPAAALGRLGDELGLADLVDTATRLRLVDSTGAQAQASLRAQAASLRDRELADAQGRANERSQSMLVAQVVLGLGFVVFLGYPAVAKVLAA